MKKNNLIKGHWRKGGVPPIVTLLIMVGFLVSTAIIVWFIIWLSQTAKDQVVLQLVDEPVVMNVGGSWHLYISLKNIGSKSIPSGTTYRVVLAGLNITGSGTLSQDFSPGSTITFDITLSGAIPNNRYKVEGKLIFEGHTTFSFVARVSRG
ncbi:MAG: hypothetical protein DRJ52_08650 [Thermoprotei archaeon]|nr:MAG: hypothetical protein DRJ52_08650 [Thermoprotei archaeon]